MQNGEFTTHVKHPECLLFSFKFNCHHPYEAKTTSQNSLNSVIQLEV